MPLLKVLAYIVLWFLLSVVIGFFAAAVTGD